MTTIRIKVKKKKYISIRCERNACSILNSYLYLIDRDGLDNYSADGAIQFVGSERSLPHRYENAPRHL